MEWGVKIGILSDIHAEPQALRRVLADMPSVDHVLCAGDAVSEYRAALHDRPGWRPALTNLAWLLAAHPDAQVRQPQEAVSLATQVVALSGKQDAPAHDLLAAALAAAGKFDEAVAVASDAIRAADAAGQTTLATAIRERVAGYRQHQPFVVR